MFKMKIALIICVIVIVIGTVSILFTDVGGDVYMQYMSLNDNTGVGVTSKVNFNKEFEYSTKQNNNTNTSAPGGNGSTITNADESKYTWGCAYPDYSGRIVTYSDGITYKVATNGPEIPYMNQNRGPWSQWWPTGGNYTVSKSGCGYVSLAMCISYLTNSNITPKDILENGGVNYHTAGSGISWSGFTGIPAKYGLVGRDIGHDLVTLAEELRKGNVAVASIKPGGNGVDMFSPNGHIVVVRGVTDDGKFLVNNCNNMGDAQLDREWTEAEMNQLIKHEWIISK